MYIHTYMHIHTYVCVPTHMQTDEQEVINFLLTTEIIPLCLRIMESGSELSKTVATFILQKILLDETGLSYICQTFERFSHVSMILVRTVRVKKKTCPNLREEYSSCGPYKFTYNIAYAHAR